MLRMQALDKIKKGHTSDNILQPHNQLRGALPLRICIVHQFNHWFTLLIPTDYGSFATFYLTHLHGCAQSALIGLMR